MPLYEYKCQKCGTVFEKIQRYSDEPLTIHEGECGGEVEKLISSPSFQFKGSGWYVTDYAKSGSSQKPSGSSSSESGKSDSGKGDSGKSDSGKSDSGKSDSSKSESKPASTTPSSSTSDSK